MNSGIFFLLAALSGVAGNAVAAELDFAHDIVPVLKKHCIKCHGGDEAEGGLSMNTRGLLLDAEVVRIGSPESSEFLQRLRSSDPDLQMPPPDEPRLSASEIELLERWVHEGVPWESGFTFAQDRYEPPLKPEKPTLPPPREGRTNPVDRLIDQYFTEQETERPHPVDEATFLRRVSLDLIGRLPTKDKAATFLADPDPAKRDRLIEELLQDRREYAAHWITFWNDLLRNSYSGTGYIDGGRKQLTGWLYQALLENKPYDEFVVELISPQPQAEGFIRGIKWRGDVNASQTRDIQFAQNVTQVFLGINMKCASCHDSFIDRWTLKETYGLAAIYATTPLEIHRCDKPTGETASAAWIFPELGNVDAAASQEERLRQLSELFVHPENGRLARTIVNRLWHRLMGRGIVHPVDAMHTPPWNADLLNYLGVYLVEQEYDLQSVLRLIVTSHAYQSQSVPRMPSDEGIVENYQFRGPLAKRMTAEQFMDSIWQVTNQWPTPDPHAFKIDGRGQGGQLAAILEVENAGAEPPADWKEAWGTRPVRAALGPPDPLQATLGRPHREQVVTTRPSQLTTLEAIYLSNGEILADTLRRGAEQLQATSPDAPEVLVRDLFLETLSRFPTSEEWQLIRAQIDDKLTARDVEDILWSVVMLPEFQLIR